MSLFCLQMTTLFVYDYGIEYDNSLPIHARTDLINESQLLKIAAVTSNVRNLYINGPVIDITPTGADRLAKLWSHVQELDLRGSRFLSQIMTNLIRHYPQLSKLRAYTYDYANVQLFDSIFANHTNLVDFEFDCWAGVEQNWFRSCRVPLKRFATNPLNDERATLDTLEKCCKDSLQTIKVGLNNEDPLENFQSVYQIFSTFH